MKSFSKIMKAALAATALAALAPSSLLACAACYGQSDSPLASGMNWGIFTLLGVIITVLATVAAFFIYLIRRGAATEVETVTRVPAGIKV